MASRLVESGVTAKEAEVLAALGEHLSNAEIASRLYISERTVESHVSSLLRKLHARNRRELAREAGAIERRTARLERAMPAALELAIESLPLVGRAGERDRLRALWERARGGRLLVAVVAGEAGVGKTRLVADLALQVYAAGGTVLYGACFEADDTPFLPFVQAIDVAVEAATPSPDAVHDRGVMTGLRERLSEGLAT